MIMKKIVYMALCACCMLSCSEDIWIEDLTEMEKDKIRGRYELVAAVWEGDPIETYIRSRSSPIDSSFRVCYGSHIRI